MSAAPVYLEAAAVSDATALEALERRCASHPWTARHFADAIRGEGGERVVVLRALDAAPIGYCVWQEVAGEVHIHNVAVDPVRRRQGLGRRLLAACLAMAARRQAQVAFLDVRAGNQAARSLYRSLGFREVAVRARYYSEPIEDAVLLEAPLADPAWRMES